MQTQTRQMAKTKLGRSVGKDIEWHTCSGDASDDGPSMSNTIFWRNQGCVMRGITSLTTTLSIISLAINLSASGA